MEWAENMDLTYFEDGKFEYEIGLWIFKYQVSQNCDWKIENGEKSINPIFNFF